MASFVATHCLALTELPSKQIVPRLIEQQPFHPPVFGYIFLAAPRMEKKVLKLEVAVQLDCNYHSTSPNANPPQGSSNRTRKRWCMENGQEGHEEVLSSLEDLCFVVSFWTAA